MSINKTKIFPFTIEQLKYFKEELKRAGTFDALMEEKQAMGREFGQAFITKYSDIEEYKSKHLIGVYASLHPFYDTEIPFAFWSELNQILLNYEYK